MNTGISKLELMIESFNSSITLLNNEGYKEQSLILFFIYLDQLGWLISSNEHSTGKDFESWINTYCDLRDLECTSTDLWNTRCSLVHMNTAEHKHFDSDKHYRLSFYENKNFSEEEILFEKQQYPKPTKLVDVGTLYKCLHKGIEDFLTDIENNSNLRLAVLNKCSKRNDLRL